MVTEQRGGLILRVFLGEPDAPEEDAEPLDGSPEAPPGLALGFIPADVARRLTQLSSLTRVPGTELPVAGLALADGAVVTVLQIGNPSGLPGTGAAYTPGDDWIAPGADRAVICHLGGFDIALTGGVVLATGLFTPEPGGDGVVWNDMIVRRVDVHALYAQAEAATWVPNAPSPARREGGGGPDSERADRGSTG